MVISPRAPFAGGDLASNTLYNDILSRYTTNWGATVASQGMQEILQQLLEMQGTTTDALANAVADASGAPPQRVGGGGHGGGGRNAGMVGGYPNPNNAGVRRVPTAGVRSPSGWALPLAAMGLSDEADRAARQARRAARDGGSYTYAEPGRDRTRERSRTHVSRDGTTTTSTNVNVSRNGGTAIAVDSGNDGNRQRRKKGY